MTTQKPLLPFLLAKQHQACSEKIQWTRLKCHKCKRSKCWPIWTFHSSMQWNWQSSSWIRLSVTAPLCCKYSCLLGAPYCRVKKQSNTPDTASSLFILALESPLAWTTIKPPKFSFNWGCCKTCSGYPVGKNIGNAGHEFSSASRYTAHILLYSCLFFAMLPFPTSKAGLFFTNKVSCTQESVLTKGRNFTYHLLQFYLFTTTALECRRWLSQCSLTVQTQTSVIKINVKRNEELL